MLRRLAASLKLAPNADSGGIMFELALVAALAAEARAPADCDWRVAPGDAPPVLSCRTPDGKMRPVPTPAGFDPGTIARAEAGDAQAMAALGVFHFGGGLGADPDQTIVWLRRAADRNDARAMSYLALIYLTGDEASGVPRDNAEALRLMRRAADLGRDEAAFNLGAMYSVGATVEPDPAEGARWLRAAADRGYAPAMRMLGLLALRAPAKDEAAALGWFRTAAEQGDRDAMIDLGRMYSLGAGFPQDLAEALRWYRKAADLGDPRGQLYVGVMHDEGLGVPADPVEAFRWFRLAAEQDLSEGSMALEFDYERGRGVGRDPARARAWRERRINSGVDMGYYGRSRFDDALLDALFTVAAPLFPDPFVPDLDTPAG